MQKAKNLAKKKLCARVSSVWLHLVTVRFGPTSSYTKETTRIQRTTSWRPAAHERRAVTSPPSKTLNSVQKGLKDLGSTVRTHFTCVCDVRCDKQRAYFTVSRQGISPSTHLMNLSHKTAQPLFQHPSVTAAMLFDILQKCILKFSIFFQYLQPCAFPEPHIIMWH
jgi:hypothetical protein